MSEQDRNANAGYAGVEGNPTDLLSLDSATQAPLQAGPGASSSQDTIINAAEMFQAQLEQMTTWKHQLAQQMEVMRRDGIKLLERQKNLAIEKKRAGEEREALAGERTRIQTLQHDLDAETRRLTSRAADLEKSHAEMEKLRGDREKWERELAAARTEVESLTARKSVTASELAAAEGRLAEIRTLEAQRESLQREITAAEARLGDCQAEKQALVAAHHEVDLRQAELIAGQKSLAGREAAALAEDVRLREAVEQLEGQRKQLAEAQRGTKSDAEKLAAQQQELAAAQGAVAQQMQQLTAREEVARAAAAELEQKRNALATRQTELAGMDAALADKTRQLETELQGRLAQAEQLRQQAAEEKQTVSAQREALQKKLEALDVELADQMDTLSKQTKRLTERRNAVEAAERELDKALEQRIAAATNAFRGELSDTRANYEQRVAALEKQLAEAQTASNETAALEAAWRKDMAKANAELATLREELLNASTVLGDTKDKNVSLAKEFAAHVERAKAEAAEWQKKLEAAQNASSGSSAAVEAAQKSNVQAAIELAETKAKLAGLKTAQEELQFQLELQKEETEKELQKVRGELAQQLGERQAAVDEWKQKYQAAMADLTKVGASAAAGDRAGAVAQQLQTLEQQRDDLAQQLFTVQDALRRTEEESLLTKNMLEGELLTTRQQKEMLEAQKASWKTAQQNVRLAPLGEGDEAEQIRAHRQRLLHKARVLRTFRQQIVAYQEGLEKSRGEIAQQREQIRARKENLEQVKRLLEKQEMVMARKLADHNAVKTVAAVGIFVIMILGGAFLAVYQFVRPVYQSEATIKLAPQVNLEGAPLAAWTKTQAEYIKSPEVTAAAWKVLRGGDSHYNMHSTTEEWLGSLTKNLLVEASDSTGTLQVRYSGPDATGVSDVCNALASAYTTPGLRESSEANRAVGLGSQTVAKATVSLTPIEDTRMMISLSVAAGVLFVSLLLVMLFRHFVARQLKEIDQMADAQDLDDMKGDLNETPTPAAG